MSDIIDNRSTKLVDIINAHLDSSGAAHFAVGYFFLSGFEAIATRLNDLSELRLLIGNTSNQQTVEQLAEGYRRLDLVTGALEQQIYRKRIEAEQWGEQTAENIRAGIAAMDQTDSAEELVASLAQMIEEKRLKVKIYTKGRLHAKAYIFDYKQMYNEKGRPVLDTGPGIGIVGSSNLSLSGITHNTELNVLVHGKTNHEQLTHWFNELWKDAEEFDAALMTEMQLSWVNPVRPYDIYMKTLHALVKDRVEGDEQAEILWPDEINNKLADFQKVAVRQAVQMINEYRGAFVADVVGLGKSFVGAAIVKHFERTDGARSLIICPAPLMEMWERYNEVYELNAAVISMGELRDGPGKLPLLERFPNRDFVLIDESHNLRHRDTQRYQVVETFLAAGRRCCLLTASPRNKSAWDIYHQIKLFHQDDRTDLPIEPANLRDFFRLVESGDRNLPDLLTKILVRRTRSHVLRWYGYDAETHERVDPTRFAEYERGERRAYVLVGGRHQFFPKRELATVEYSIEQTYQGLYQSIRRTLGKASEDAPEERNHSLTFARYGLWRYVKRDKQKVEPYTTLKRAGTNLRGLIRIMLFKRFESSVYAFRETVKRLIRVHELFRDSMLLGIVPAGEEAQGILYDWLERDESELADALAQAAGQYSLSDFEADRLLEDIEHDIQIMHQILEMVEPISPEQDVKLLTLKERLALPPIKGNKVLIFTQYADTADYLFKQLNPGRKHTDIEVVFSRDKNKAKIVGRFSPGSNPEHRPLRGESEISILIATDVLAEGLNLQDGNIIINYDLHWNPVRLIQRFGRIDRIGTEHDRVYGINFLPETELERNLGLREKLRNRIAEIHESIGEDAAILDPSEQLNPNALYAIYEATQGTGNASVLLDEAEQYLDLGEAEEILRQLRKEQPGEYKRIADLRDGIRSGMKRESSQTYIFCQSGNYQQLFVLDTNGQIVTRDIPRILGLIQCSPEEATVALPKNHNESVMRVKQQFAQEVQQRKAQREFSASLSAGQKYVLRELRGLFSFVDDEDAKSQVNILDRAFRGAITKAVSREINLLRRHGVRGEQLIKALRDIYFQHNMRDWLDRRGSEEENDQIPRIICSEALI